MHVSATCGADAVLRRHICIEADFHVSASKRQYPVVIADTTGYFYIFPATRAEKAKLSGSAINLDTKDTPFGDGMHAAWRLHIFTMFVVDSILQCLQYVISLSTYPSHAHLIIYRDTREGPPGAKSVGNVKCGCRKRRGVVSSSQSFLLDELQQRRETRRGRHLPSAAGLSFLRPTSPLDFHPRPCRWFPTFRSHPQPRPHLVSPCASASRSA